MIKEVMCIKEGLWIDISTSIQHSYGPKYGEKCKVIGLKPGGFYIIEGYERLPFYEGLTGYNPIRFIDISDIDETEMVREELTVKV